MNDEKLIININDEKEIKQEKKDKRKSNIIWSIILSIILILTIIFNSYYFYRVGYEKGIENYIPLTLHQKIDRPMQKADLNTSVEWNNEFYYPNTTFELYLDNQTLQDYNESALVYYVDNITYLYYFYDVENELINFYITNGQISVPIAKYDLVVGDGYYEPELINASDGYLHYIVVDELTSTSFYNSNFIGLFLNYMPDYNYFGVHTTPLMLSVGGTNSAISYDNGYNAGFLAGKNEVLDNPNSNGLFTQTQFDNQYNVGFQAGANSITPDIATNGFITLMNVIFNAPYNIFHGFLNFEIFGVNLFNLLSFVFTTSIAFLVIKLIFLNK